MPILSVLAVVFSVVFIIVVIAYAITRPDTKTKTAAYVHAKAGIQNHAAGDLAGAEREFAEALDISPTLITAHLGRADLFYAQKRYDEALADLDQVIALDPSARALFLRGETYAAQQRFDEAIRDFDQAFSFPLDRNWVGIVNTQLGWAKLSKAFTLSAAERRTAAEDALIDLDEAVYLDPRNPSALLFRGQAYLLTQQNQAALSDFERAAELKPDHKLALAGQAVAQYALGHLDEAKALWAKLPEFDADYANPDKLRDEYRCADSFLEAAHKVAAL